MGTAGTEQT